MTFKTKTRATCLMFAGFLLGGAIGCNEDNEKDAKLISSAPAPGATGAISAQNQQEYAKQNKGINGGAYKGSGYPGAR